MNYDTVKTFGDIRLTDRSDINASGDGGGKIQVQGQTIDLLSYSEIRSRTAGSAAGEKIILRASSALNVVDISSDGNDFSVVRGGTLNTGTGDGVSIDIQAPILIIDGGFITTATEGKGKAGNITVNAERIFLDRSGQIFSGSFSEGGSGNLEIRASQLITMTEMFPAVAADGTKTYYHSGIFTGSERGSTGAGGNILIETPQLNLINGGAISPSTLGQGDGGNLIIRASNILIDGVRQDSYNALSGIQTETIEGAQGRAGSLTIISDRLQLLNGGQISASNLGTGEAGNLSITTSQLEIAGFDDVLQLPSTTRRKLPYD